MRDRQGRSRHHRRLPAGRAGRARGAADHERHHPGTLLRRGGRDAARRSRAVRHPGEPRVRTGAAEAVLRDVRLRAAGGGQRQRHLAVARAAAQLPARPGAEVPGLQDRGTSRPAGRPDLAVVPGPLAVEPEHLADRPADAGGRKNPPAIQRMEADDLMAAVFPTLAACQENVAPGPMDIPDHVLVRQTLTDCLNEAMDIGGLKRLLSGIESGQVSVVVRDTTEPSVLAHEILNGRPFTYLDDAPLEERRSRAVPLRRGLPVEAQELGRLDSAAIERVAGQVRPDPRGPDELHDLLMTLTAVRPAEDWRPWFDELTRDRRAVSIYGPAGVFWCAVERRPAIEALFPDAAVVPDHPCPVPAARAAPADPDVAAADMLRGHLDCRGPSAIADLAQSTGLPDTVIEIALARLEEEGFAIRGRFTGPGGAEEFCARRLLARIHVYTRQRQRREIEPVTARDFMRFLLRWQRIAPGTRGEGRRGVLSVIEQLQGYELAAGAWENAVLAARVEGYRREWLDEACLSGQVTWGRLSVRDIEPDPAPRRSGLVPSRATPITLTIRDDLPWLLRAARGDQ